MFKVVIVGSGAAATGAALQLARKGIRPVILDIGVQRRSPEIKIPGNLYGWRNCNDSFDYHIGNDFIGIDDLISVKNSIPKLNTPNFAYIKQLSSELSPVVTEHFDVTQSAAFGGLGNAWGAGMYRLVDQDLKGFPFKASALDPYADFLTKHMGITGTEDDLTEYFGVTDHLLPPLNLSRNSKKILDSYNKAKQKLNEKGVSIGRPRIAALSVPYRGRPAVGYNNTEFWQSSDSIYTPSITLNELIKDQLIEYKSGWIVESFKESIAGVSVQARNVHTDEKVSFDTEKLLLAAGAISTTKIVLESAHDYSTVLPLFDNAKLQVPLIIPGSIGNRLDIHSFGLTQLNIIWSSTFYTETLQGSLMELTSPMRAEFFPYFPLSAVGKVLMIKKLLPSLMLMQLFFPGEKYGRSELKLSHDGSVLIKGVGEDIKVEGVRELLYILRRIGLWTLSSMVQNPTRGNSLHYACSLPMKSSPCDYQCHSNGLLAGTNNIYVCDSAAFSSLPAKNMSFGMMSNAMRVSDMLEY